MPTVYKSAVMRPLPSGAELFEQNGRSFARWSDSRGRVRTAPVTVPDKGPYAGQQRVVIESDRYVVRYRDEAGVIRTVGTDCREEEDARRLLDQLLQQVEAARRPENAGPQGEEAPEPQSEKPTQILRALRDHFRGYVRFLKSHDTPAVRIADIERQVRRIARQCGFLRLSEIDAHAVKQWLVDREADGMPAKARNAHLDDLMNFVEWCLRERLLPHNPLRGIKKIQDAGEAVAPSVRPLSEEELTRLLRIALWRPLAEYGRTVPAQAAPGGAPSAPHFTPLTIETIDELVARGRQQLKDDRKQIVRLRSQGWQRALIYKTLALVGLRRSEMVSLKTGAVRLKRRSPVLLVGAKAGEETAGTTIPLRADLAADLRLWLRHRWRSARKAAHGRERDALRKAFVRRPLFKLPAGLAKLLAIDLQAAGIGETDEQGVRIDVHAARLVRETLLARKGSPLSALWAPAGEERAEPGAGRTLKQGLLEVFKLRGRKNDQSN